MVKHLQNLMFSIFIFLILQNFLNRYLLSRQLIHPKIHHSESTLPCHSLNLVLVEGLVGFGMFLGDRNTVFVELVGLGFEGFFWVGKFV